MIRFEDRDDVEEWLEPLDYEEFWREVAFFDVSLPSREDCDDDIWRGRASEALVLDGLKAMARVQIVIDRKLPPRFVMSETSLH